MRNKQVETRTGDNRTPERKEKVASDQAERRKRLTQAAQLAGYDTIDKLAKAILNGDVEIVIKV